MSVLIAKSILGVLSVGASTALGVFIYDSELFGVYGMVEMFVTSATISKSNGSNSSDLDAKKITCKLSDLSETEIDCQIFKNEVDTKLSTQKHSETKNFSTKIPKSKDIKENEYYRIKVSKKLWNTWSDTNNQAKTIVIGFDGTYNTQTLNVLFTLRNETEILWAEDKEQKYTFIGQAVQNEGDTTTTEITKSDETGKSYSCSSTKDGSDFKDCKIYDFESTDTTGNWSEKIFANNKSDVAKVKKDSYYRIETKDLKHGITEIWMSGKDTTKKLKTKDLKKAIVANDMLFFIDKKSSSKT